MTDSTASSSTCPKAELHAAAEHVRQAASATAERIVGADASHHLRQAVRHMFQAGISALDQAEQRSKDRQAAAQPAK